MARFVNIYTQRNICISKAYNGDFGKWITETDFMFVIETDSGVVEIIPGTEEYLIGATADSILESYIDEEYEVLIREDCPARDRIIRDNITEWICNTGTLFDYSVARAICDVVSLLTKHGMWKDEYGDCIDVERIKEEYGEE